MSHPHPSTPGPHNTHLFRPLSTPLQAPDSPSVIAKVVGRDPRVRIVRSTERLGLQGAWREAFHRAVGFVCEETGEAPRYFAWTSDHDVWNCDWLRTLVPILERHRSAVLAHSWVETIDESGRMQPGPIPIFETEQQHSVPHRIVHSIRAMNGAGNAVYGLFRVEALTQCGVFREVLMPDRLLLTELALEGRVIQHPQVLWLRRATGTFSLRRQRARLFREGGRPWSTLLPWWIVHGAILGRELHRGGATWPASIGVSIRFGIVQGLKSCKQTLLGLLRKAPRR
ncbi:MAG: glycosyltransferase [Planctomycetota bacterium]